MAAQYKIIHPVKYFRDYLNENIRPDGREIDKFRPIILNVNSIGTADGSAVVKIGNTTVVCGIKAELAPPKTSEPENGFIVPNIELTSLCSSKFRPGAPTEEAQVYAYSLVEIIKNSNCINIKDLCIVKEKLVWVLYCDITCLDHDGSVLDAALIALIAALKTVKLPLVDYNIDTNLYKVDEEIKKPISINCLPVSTSFIIFDENIIITDPTAEEENLSTSNVTIAVSNSEIAFIYKPGGSPINPKQLENCLEQALKREKLVCDLMESIIK